MSLHLLSSHLNEIILRDMYNMEKTLIVNNQYKYDEFEIGGKFHSML
jgi:hypothetical protein